MPFPRLRLSSLMPQMGDSSSCLKKIGVCMGFLFVGFLAEEVVGVYVYGWFLCLG